MLIGVRRLDCFAALAMTAKGLQGCHFRRCVAQTTRLCRSKWVRSLDQRSAARLAPL